MYNVVFEGTGVRGSNSLGIRTWTRFDNQAKFLAFMEESGCKDRIVAKGVTENEAIRLTRETSGAARARAALTESGGNPALFQHYLMNAATAATNEGHGPDFLDEMLVMQLELLQLAGALF